MSSVSAACIFDAYSASSAHTDTFYIVSQIVRVRNSKRHFFSKLTFPYIIQPLRFHPTATSTTTALLSPYGHIDHSRSASPYDNIDHSHSASPYGNIDHSHSASPYDNIDHSHSASPYGNIDHNRSASPYGNIDHNHSASPYGNIDHSRSASPYGNIDHSLSFRTTKPFEQLCRKFFVFF